MTAYLHFQKYSPSSPILPTETSALTGFSSLEIVDPDVNNPGVDRGTCYYFSHNSLFPYESIPDAALYAHAAALECRKHGLGLAIVTSQEHLEAILNAARKCMAEITWRKKKDTLLLQFVNCPMSSTRLPWAFLAWVPYLVLTAQWIATSSTSLKGRCKVMECGNTATLTTTEGRMPSSQSSSATRRASVVSLDKVLLRCTESLAVVIL